ncbi:MAG: ATP-binding protein [Bacteroidetes bacterium]|nr:ATP-binding protein [Bacteroidota bacterium]
MMQKYIRLLTLTHDETFFLWGPRQAGKTTLLKKHFSDAFWIDLLLPDVYRTYLTNPEQLIEEVKLKKVEFVVIDEIQKLPQLLDVVHWLIENEGIHFALCGSSARKVKRGHANLLGGRGVKYELYGLSAREIADDLDFLKLLNQGYIAPIYQSKNPKRLLNSYIAQYLKEEIAAEGLVRNLPGFSEFLNIAALSDTELLNYSTIARDVGIASSTIKGYFEILTDTLLGRFLPSYKKRPKRRISNVPKFYFFDVGVVNFLAKRGEIQVKSELIGKAFENWIFHELCCYNSYCEKFADYYYWRLSSGVEVDFIVNHIDCAIESKSSEKIKSQHLKGLRELKKEHPEVKKMIIVSMDTHDRETEDGILVLHYTSFLDYLWGGSLF